ncbi:MAG: RsmG family class I SAM-dependent methyltransferase [Acidimicrobiia bacterium]
MALHPDRLSPAEIHKLRSVAGLADIRLSDDQVAQLDRLAVFLRQEAIPLGGMGPNESARLVDRHLADALAYLVGIPSAAQRLVDVGSGVGLPGIPLAIARPDLEITLLDRSQRRTDLAVRAVVGAGAANVAVVCEDARSYEPPWDVVVFRASLPVPEAAGVFAKLAAADGVGLVGVSRSSTPPVIADPPDGVAFFCESIATEVLDSPFWLLRMSRT